MIFLGVDRCAGLRDGVMLAEGTGQIGFVDLSGYPPWLVVLVGTLVTALAIWILLKLLKLALWLLFFAVLIGGTCWAAWLLLQ